MYKILLLAIFFVQISFLGYAQKKVFTKTGIASFYSKTSIEKIEAVNRKVLAVFDLEKNNIEFSILIKGFEFEKALMQEHFNEDYLESDKYPKAVFKGKFEGQIGPILFDDNKKVSLKVAGSLTMHGVTKVINTIAIIEIKNKTMSANANFKLILNDYNIRVPALVANNISKEIEIKINIPSLQDLK